MKRHLIFVFVILLAAVQAFAVSDTKTRKLFIVASYSRDNVCGSPQEAGALKELRSQGWIEGKNLLVERFYMKTKSRYVTAQAIRQRGQEALRRIRAFAPDVVLTLDDNAFREVGLRLAGQPLPVVFSGVNGQPETYNQQHLFMQNRQHPGGNITGVYEKLYFRRSIEVFASAFPSAKGKKVVALLEDTPTGRAIAIQIRQETPPSHRIAGIECSIRMVHSWDEYREQVTGLNRDPQVAALYPVVLQAADADGNLLTAKEIFTWTVKHNHKPDLAVNYHFAELGYFGGAAVDFDRMGATAGRQIALILDGTPPGNISIVDAPDYALVFNLTRTRQLKLDLPTALLTAADHIYR